MAQTQAQPPSEGPTPFLQKLHIFLYVEESTRADNRFEDSDSGDDLWSSSARSGSRAVQKSSRFWGTDERASVSTLVDRYDDEEDRMYEVGRDELTLEPGFWGKTLTLVSSMTGATRKTYENQKGYFTVAEVVEAIEDVESIDRPKTEWFGDIDSSHVFFDGLKLNRAGDAYSIYWGS